MFQSSDIDQQTLLQRAYNLRWAAVPQGVIPLTAADLDFPCAPVIHEAVQQYVSKRYFNYGPAEGLPFFKESMAAFFSNKRNHEIDPSQILPVDSAAFGIYLTCKTFLRPGDEAIIFDPVDFLFRYSIETVGATAVSFAIPPGTEVVDFAQMETLITSKTKMICLCNPLNPTGKVFTKQELEQLANIAQKHQLIILSDEIWSDIVFTPHSYTSIASLHSSISERTVIVTGFSKSYGLAGMRIGIVATRNKELFNQLFAASLHQSTIHGANVVGQVAAHAALTLADDWLQAFLMHLQKMRDLCVASIQQIQGFSCIAPEGCYVAFANIEQTGLSSKEIHALLLEKAKVAIVPGLKEWFGQGAEGYIRFSFATSESILVEAFDRIHQTISSR